MLFRLICVSIGFAITLLLSSCARTGDERSQNPVILTFSADANPSDFGSSVTITWSTQHASQIQLSREGEILSNSAQESGSLEVTLAATSIYVLTARNDVGESSAELEIQVKPSILELSVDTNVEAVIGKALTVRWKTGGADELILSTTDGFSHRVDAESRAEGEIDAPVPADGNFTLSARSGIHEAEKTINVFGVTQDLPVIDAFEVSLDSVTTGHPTSVTLIWWVTGATELSLLMDDTPVDLGDRSIEADSISFTIDAETAFTIRAKNPAGTTSRTVTVEGVDEPKIRSFLALPSRVAAGESFTLRWVTEDSVAVEIERDGIWLPGTLDRSGQLDQTISADTHYLLRTFNSAGLGIERDLVVSIGLPVVLGFKAEPRNVAPSSPVSLSWEVDGGSAVLIRDPVGQEISACSSTDLEQVQDGSCSFSGPDELGIYVYELVVRTASEDEVRAQTTVHVVNGPTIDYFEISESEIDLGDLVTLSWEVGADPAGVEPTLSLTDDRGTSYSLSEQNSNRASLDLILEGLGTYTFTLTAATPGTERVEKTVGVTVYPIPTVRLSASPDPFDPDVDDALTLTWSSENASSLTIWELDDDGQPMTPALFVAADEAERASGSLELLPSRSTTYAAVVSNRRGTVAEARVAPDVLGPEIISFEADPSDVLRGGHATLRWKTTRAASVSVNGESGLPTEGELEVAISSTTNFTLTALGSRGQSVSDSITVTAHWEPRISRTSYEPQFVFEHPDDPDDEIIVSLQNTGDPIVVWWDTIDAVSVYVKDETGKVVCDRSGSTVPSGGCSFTEEEPGAHTYSIVAVGTLGTEAVRKFDGEFLEPLRINSVEVAPSLMSADQLEEVRLSWDAEGASTVKVYANGQELPGLEDVNPNQDLVIDRPTHTTTYLIVLESPDGRRVEKSITSTVRTVGETTLTQTKYQSDGTDEVMLEWDYPVLVEGATTVTMEPESFPMEEVFDSSFIDIETTGTLLVGSLSPEGVDLSPWANVSVEFPGDFSFPFFGEEYEEVYPSIGGFIGLGPGANYDDPSRLLEFQAAKANIAPFWESLRSYGKGRILSEYIPDGSDPTKDQFIVQWNAMQFRTTPVPSTADDAKDDLTFQAALFRDGSIEFRYKTMFSGTGSNRVGATGAAIGFHEPIEQMEMKDPYYRGYELYYRLPNPVPLEGRTFRYEARKPQGSFIVKPEETTEYKICIEAEGFKACESAVVVVPEMGDLVFTELSLDPAGGSAEQWFEVRNTTPHPIDVGGMRVVSNAGEYLIANEQPLTVGSGGFLIFAVSESPLLKPDYIYGGALALGAGVDRLRIMHSSRTIAEVSWDESWEVPHGKTLTLDANV